MSTTYPTTNSELRADWMRTHYQTFAGVAHTGTIAQSERIYLPAHTEITVDFGKRIPALKFQLGDSPAWSDTVVAAIRASASYKERLAKRTNKAEPCITYTGRTLPKRGQKPLTPPVKKEKGAA